MPETAEPKENSGDVIQHNFDLLEIALVEDRQGTESDKLRNELNGILGGDTRFEKDKVFQGLRIVYETKTGQIKSLPQTYSLGDFSILRTYLTYPKDRQNLSILLYYPGDWPTPQQYASAVAGEQVGPETEDKRILPERLYTREEAKRVQIDPLALQGILEPWGESKLCGYSSEPLTLEEYKSREPNKVFGDEIVLQTIRKFNKIYGPPR